MAYRAPPVTRTGLRAGDGRHGGSLRYPSRLPPAPVRRDAGAAGGGGSIGSDRPHLGGSDARVRRRRPHAGVLAAGRRGRLAQCVPGRALTAVASSEQRQPRRLAGPHLVCCRSGGGSTPQYDGRPTRRPAHTSLGDRTKSGTQQSYRALRSDGRCTLPARPPNPRRDGGWHARTRDDTSTGAA